MSVLSNGASLSNVGVGLGDGPGGSNGSWWSMVSQAVFGLAFVLSKRQPKETTSLVVLQSIDFLQVRPCTNAYLARHSSLCSYAVTVPVQIKLGLR